MAFLIFMAMLVALISALPVLLLFFVTAVPIWVATLLAAADIGIVIAFFRFERTPALVLGAIAGWIGVAVLAVILSQAYASTPAITDESGSMVPGSIATLETVDLNGSTQWVTIRGHSTDLPVLLFLAGGPGGSELVMTRRYLGDLEQHFVVVNWDQPGTGKSYNAVPFDELTPERVVSDAHALTLYLRDRFGQDKIYVFGESWGSILGVMLVQAYPDLFHALVTTGQMVDPVENDTLMREFALELLREQGRTDSIARIEQDGPPPWAASELIGKFGAINGVINNYMEAHARGEGTGHNLFFDSLGAQEYGLLDKVYWVLGLANTFTTLYPQLNDVDFRTQASQLDVPVYMIKGRWDANAVNALTEEYFALLEAPHKELIYFEDSAHTPSWDEPQRFIDMMVNTVLAQREAGGE
ncbi:MAG: alpha/beta fold hydrolase [Chloroflexi bacterium]|nr:alpha/beta fold hydrolase [Chloroflexota bacterium]